MGLAQPNGDDWSDVEFRLPATSDAPGLARERLTRLVPLSRRADDAILLASELVTNAVRHAGSARFGDVLIRVVSRDHRVRVEVLNPGASFDPPTPTTPSTTGTGLGLFLVDALSDRWGVDSEGPRTKVWFEIAEEDGTTVDR